MNQLNEIANKYSRRETQTEIHAHLRANNGVLFLLGVLSIPTARRATAPRSGVLACVEGVPARNSGSARGAWLID